MSQVASSEPRLAEEETKLATNPAGTESSTDEKPATSADEQPATSTKEEPTTNDEKPATYTDMASNAASTVASSATTAAAGVKDSVFSMFGGGEKKETKVQDDDAVNDRSGSAKAQKEKEDEEVGYNNLVFTIGSASKNATMERTLIYTFNTGGQSRRRGS